MNPNYTLKILSENHHSIHFKVAENQQYLTFTEVFELWKNNTEFILFYVHQLQNFNYNALYWEHPAIKENYLQKEYECIVIKSQSLENATINTNAFSTYILNTQEKAADFLNLGKDARLIVPTQQKQESIYNHLAKFIRHAKEAQIITLFNTVGKAMLEEVKEKQKTIWLNTAGNGVIWLHIRLDTRPKYYKTIDYKKPNYLETL